MKEETNRPELFQVKSVTMMMEFQGLDHLLPSGHGIKLVMTTSGKDYLAPACGALWRMPECMSTLQ